MSTDERTAFGRRLPAVDRLANPLLGIRPRRTAIGIGYLFALTSLFAVSYAGSAVTVDGDPLDTVVPGFDAVSTVLILLATATITVGPLLYAAWNGGPVLSFAFPLVPLLPGYVVGGGYVLGLDGTIALTVGAAASALALLATDVRSERSLRPWRYPSVDSTRVLAASVATVIAAVGVGRFLGAATSTSLAQYRPFGILWLPTLAIVGSYWYALVRTRRPDRLDDSSAIERRT